MLEAAPRDLAQPWEGGPFAEPAREQLSAHADRVIRWLATFDRLGAQIAAAGQDWVITHGEPHACNLIDAGGRLLLIDWDTVALAPPERDLWMLGDSPQDFAQYVEAAQSQPDQVGFALYRLAWTLSDLAAFIATLRSSHRRTTDMRLPWNSFICLCEDGPPGADSCGQTVGGRETQTSICASVRPSGSGTDALMSCCSGGFATSPRGRPGGWGPAKRLLGWW